MDVGARLRVMTGVLDEGVGQLLFMGIVAVTFLGTMWWLSKGLRKTMRERDAEKELIHRAEVERAKRDLG